MAAQNESSHGTTHISLVMPLPKREEGSGETAAETCIMTRVITVLKGFCHVAPCPSHVCPTQQAFSHAVHIIVLSSQTVSCVLCEALSASKKRSLLI